MSAAATAPAFGGYQSLRRFTVDEYHKMIQAGILNDEDRVELLEGHVVLKMPRNPPHDGTIDQLGGILPPVIPPGWYLRVQNAITLNDSEPEPDFALVRGTRRTYYARHPTAADIGLVIEVADSSLDRDRTEKARIYAGAGIAVYWIINLVNRQVEVLTAPAALAYGQTQIYPPGAAVPLSLDGVLIASIPSDDLLP
jgi:Uma2 family endonuclease